jgi:hypothetical protein
MLPSRKKTMLALSAQLIISQQLMEAGPMAPEPKPLSGSLEHWAPSPPTASTAATLRAALSWQSVALERGRPPAVRRLPARAVPQESAGAPPQGLLRFQHLNESVGDVGSGAGGSAAAEPPAAASHLVVSLVASCRRSFRRGIVPRRPGARYMVDGVHRALTPAYVVEIFVSLLD